MLTELTMCDDGIGYFDYMECVAELAKTEHIRLKDGKYSLTDKGMRNGGILEDNLPQNVRMHVEDSTFAMRSELSRNFMIKTYHTKKPDGSCKVTLLLSDGVEEVVSIEMFAVNEHQARALKKGFRNNAESIYNSLVGMILD